MPLQIELWPVGRLLPYARNPRRNDHAVDRMASSIQEFGFKIPILARSSGEIVDGHLRLKAAHKLSLPEVPVLLCDEWTEAQVKAFRLLVNRSANWADWDSELLSLELEDLRTLDFDLNLTGFEPLEIDQLLSLDEDEVPEPSADSLAGAAVSKTGDLWQCGKHRILCGDATSESDVQALLGTTVPHLMVTDPPYGVDYDPNWREQAGLGKQRQTGTVTNDHQVDWTQAWHLFPGQVAYVWHAGVHTAQVAESLLSVGFRIRAQIIWVKQHFALGRGDFHWQHEPCWYAVRENESSHWNGDRTQSTVWEVSNLNPFGGLKEEPATGHGTQKPLELMRRAILNNSVRGEVIYDPFLGSGTTLLAAEKTDRICYGLEIDPRYVDVIVRRWQQATGQKAKRSQDGRLFDEIENTPTPKEATDASAQA